MFENIIGHSSFIEQLKKEIKSDSFPSSVLISGPLYSGKQAIALEIARAVTCEQDADWNCMCQSCRLHRVLANPQIALLGWDLFIPEIFAVKNVLEKKRDNTSCYLFIRGVRKLLRRFDSVLVEENDSKFKKISSLLANTEELLADFDPEHGIESKVIDIKTAETIVENCKTIVNEYKFTNIPVDQIRKVSYWVRFSGYGNKKIIIIENAENMNDSSRNALLKILEEPPNNTFFILLTCRPGEIIPTIKSRLRKYEITERSIQENKTVIERIFKEETRIFTGIKEYLDSTIPETALLKKAAKQFIVSLYDSNNEHIGLPQEIKTILKSQFSEYYPAFLSEILNLSRELLHNSDFINNNPENIAFIKKINTFVNESYKGFEKLNINHELLTESMFLELRNR
ncbi:MAG: hypothetical protein FWC36_09120 [Spirochaetes bacterium]|nr:hypothetical protein [Spirochaetota bacterium]